MVSVLAIIPKVSGFKPGRVNEFLRVIKIHRTPSFGGKVKPEAICLMTLRHAKITCSKI
jgi:hypothetical protein